MGGPWAPWVRADGPGPMGLKDPWPRGPGASGPIGLETSPWGVPWGSVFPYFFQQSLGSGPGVACHVVTIVS